MPQTHRSLSRRPRGPSRASGAEQGGRAGPRRPRAGPRRPRAGPRRPRGPSRAKTASSRAKTASSRAKTASGAEQGGRAGPRRPRAGPRRPRGPSRGAEQGQDGLEQGQDGLGGRAGGPSRAKTASGAEQGQEPINPPDQPVWQLKADPQTRLIGHLQCHDVSANDRLIRWPGFSIDIA